MISGKIKRKNKYHGHKNKFILVAHGSSEEVNKAHGILKVSTATETIVHEN